MIRDSKRKASAISILRSAQALRKPATSLANAISPPHNMLSAFSFAFAANFATVLPETRCDYRSAVACRFT